ncbi:tetratricopeptide repeat protein, partial [bacterium]|nr:tetratricopeptide repeat protein [bacterium]
MRMRRLPSFLPTAILWLAAALAAVPVGIAGEGPKLAEAQQAIAKGKYADGLKALDALLEAKLPADAEGAARTVRVRALSDTGRYKGAAAEASKVVQLAPKSPDALALHAEALMAVGRTKQAAERLSQARKLDGDHVRTRLIALQLARITGDKDALRDGTDHFFRLYSQRKAATAEALTAVAIAAENDDPHGAWRAYAEAHRADPKYLDAYLHAGFHCIRKYAWKYATEEFQKALKLNPHCAVAHAGLAIVALRNGKFKPAQDTLDTALKINPNLPVARQLRAALLTMEERHDEARQQLQHVLDVNPNDLAALSLLAAHHEARGKPAERDAVVKQVLRLNSHHADLYTTLARAGERRRQFPRAVEWARQAIETDPGHWEGYYIADMNLLRIGEEREGYQLVGRAFKLNPFNVWAYNMLNVLDRDFKQKRFEQFETDHFVVKLPTSQSAILWPYVQTVLEEAWAKFTVKYAMEPKGPKEYGGKVLILFFPDHTQFSARTVGLPGLGALGACFGQVITMPSPRLGRMRRGGLFNWRAVLEHEFCHVVTLQKTHYHIPRWFTEGISTYEEVAPQIRWDALLVRAVAQKELLPLAKLNTGFSRPKTRHQVPVSYYQSSLICEYLEQTHGADALRKACELYAKGQETPAVLAAVTGKPLAELDTLTCAYAREYASRIKVSPPVDPKQLEALEKKVKENDSDAEAWSGIAAGQLARRKFKEAREAAQKAAKLDPKLARPYAILGILALNVDKKKDEAKAQFALARDADADYFAPRLYLGLM